MTDCENITSDGTQISHKHFKRINDKLSNGVGGKIFLQVHIYSAGQSICLSGSEVSQ